MLEANSQRVSERLYDLIVVDEGNELRPSHSIASSAVESSVGGSFIRVSQAMSPEVKVELARLIPCGVTYHEITRDRKIVR
jgi:hypothetical protein